jgi:pseudaminic acid cytidylyltransferase
MLRAPREGAWAGSKQCRLSPALHSDNDRVMSVVAIIPARAGSKRIPGKNTRPFLGRPIIAYSIEAARAAELFDRIVVSTDSRAMGEVAQRYGAEVPFARPADLSDDRTPTAPVVAHAVRWLRAHGERVSEVCCLYATAPFVQARHLREGYRLLTERRAASVVAVTSFPFPILRALRVDGSGHLRMFWPEHELTRSQDLPAAFHDAGQFYWLAADAFLANEAIYTDDALPVVLPRYLVQDIDTPEDWETAEAMYRALRSSGRI